MGSEAAMWSRLRVQLRLAELTRHEDKLQPGISDVSYVDGGTSGWIELKYLKAFPKRATTVVKLPHYTPEQRLFLRRKGRNGGNAWLLVQVDREMFLFDWRAAWFVGREMVTRDFYDLSWYHTKQPYDYKALSMELYKGNEGGEPFREFDEVRDFEQNRMV